MSISFSEDAQQEVVTSSRVLPEDSGEGSLRPRLLRDYTGQEKQKKIFRSASTLRVCAVSRSTTCCSTALRVWARRQWPPSSQMRWV